MALSASLNFFFQFAKSGAGVTGKSGSITVTVKKLTRSSSPTITTVTTTGGVVVGSVTEVDATNNKGLYVVGVSGLDPAADYLATAHYTGTSTDVDNVDVAALWSEFSATINAGAIPQVTAGTANGGLPTLDTNGDISSKLGVVAMVALLQVENQSKGTIWIVDPINGNDGNVGTWASPFKTPLPTAVGGAHPASAGDLVFVCAGTSSMGTSEYIMPDGVTLCGAGINATILTSAITSGAGKCVIRTGNNCVVKNLYVQCTVMGTFALPIGNITTQCVNVLIENVRVFADTDGLNFAVAGSTVLVRRCELYSNWDICLAKGIGTFVVIEDSHGYTTAQNSALANSNSSIQSVDGARLRIVRTPLINIAANVNASRQTHMIRAVAFDVAGASVELISSPVYLSVDGVTIQNLCTDTDTTIVVENSPYDPTLVATSGTLVDLTNKTGLDFRNYKLPGTATAYTGVEFDLVNAPNATAVAAIQNGLPKSVDYTTARAAKLDNADVATSSRLAASSYVAPDNTDIVTALSDLVQLLGRTDPTTAVNAIKTVTDKLNTTLQLNGSNYQFTQSALALAPTGSGGSSSGSGPVMIDSSYTGATDLTGHSLPNLIILNATNNDPIAGATLRVYDQSLYISSPSSTPFVEVQTRVDGSWPPVGLDHNVAYIITVQALGFVEQEAALIPTLA